MHTNSKKFKKEFIDVLRISASDPVLFEALLCDFLTESEQDQLPVRWQIIKRLYEGQPQRKISVDLGVGIATVTRGSEELQDQKGGFYQYLQKYYK